MQFNNAFSESMKSKSNADLIEMIYFKAADYQPDAISAAEQELKNRKLSKDQIGNIRNALVRIVMNKRPESKNLADNIISFARLFMPHHFRTFFKNNYRKDQDLKSYYTRKYLPKYWGLIYIGIILLCLALALLFSYSY